MARHRSPAQRVRRRRVYLFAGLGSALAMMLAAFLVVVPATGLARWIVGGNVESSGGWVETGILASAPDDDDATVRWSSGFPGRPGRSASRSGIGRTGSVPPSPEEFALEPTTTVGSTVESNEPGELIPTESTGIAAPASKAVSNGATTITTEAPTPTDAPPTAPKSTTTTVATPTSAEASTTQSVTTQSITTQSGHHDSGPSTVVAHEPSRLAALRNANPLFARYATVPSEALNLGALTEPATRPDNGTVGDGQFRVACQYSHFAYDDPIMFPGQPGASHLHMFFGNTEADANSTVDSLVNSGGGTCNGFELNRSAYWTPALLDGRGNVVIPEKIILYYKSKFPDQVRPLPQGLKMISGSTSGTFDVSNELYWSCGSNGYAYNKSNRIPDCGGDVINASVVFPECWDGVNLDSPDHRSHLRYVNPTKPCPSSHPVRLPQISLLLYFPGADSVDGWHLSADAHHGGGPPGGSLHADWFGGWNDETMRLWIDGCMVRARNCSFGQTGTDRRLAALNPLQNHPGPYLLPLP